MRRVVGPEMGVKAAGGVRDLEGVKAMAAAGASRIGASAGVKIVRGTGPTDSSLQQTKGLLIGMLTEYAKAVQLQDHQGNAGPHMYRAYGLANYAHTVLTRAERPLSKLGCDVRPLL